MASVCASLMLMPGYTAGGYWEDGFLLRVVANGEWMGKVGPRSWNIGGRGGISRIQERDYWFCTGYNFA